ncbi:hypothetical protein M0D21_10785 [Aquimarina sp. D1M17]|uniref:hypothetical protein n=1 Tax=Aquimarina acroporae TaxID=2937283 RepID=UPI0020BD8A96|nr:hypothetical protein [Aquimarina acroporae]MCK8522056.1 hypothetical protein [Aquimarina acroporae]
MIKKVTFLLLLGISLISCENDSVDDAVFNEENNPEAPSEIIDVYVDDSKGL